MLEKENLASSPVTSPDPYAELAVELHKVADQIATLAGTGLRSVTTPYLSFAVSYSTSEADKTVPAVDAIAAALGGKARTTFEGRGASRRGDHVYSTHRGRLYVRAHAYVPVPPTRAQKLSELQAENDRLRAELQGGGQA